MESLDLGFYRWPTVCGCFLILLVFTVYILMIQWTVGPETKSRRWFKEERRSINKKSNFRKLSKSKGWLGEAFFKDTKVTIVEFL